MKIHVASNNFDKKSLIFYNLWIWFVGKYKFPNEVQFLIKLKNGDNYII